MYYIRERRSEGIPGGLYRDISEITRDMVIIENKIKETEAQLSSHNLIMTILESGKTSIDREMITSIEEVIEGAERALFHLERLRDGMNYLEEELSQVRWLLKKNA